MPQVFESPKRLEKSKSALEEVFEESVFPYLNALLARRGFQVVKYFNGILGEIRSKEIVALFEKAAQDKTCLTVDALGNDVVTMGSG